MIKVKILTEGGERIGYGHLSRCISLYEEMQIRGIQTEFIVYGSIKAVDFLKGIPVIYKNWIDLDFLKSHITHDDYVVVDSYIADSEHYRIIAELSKKAVYLDDFGRIPYPRGIIVNPSLEACHIDYSYGFSDTVLTGAEYVLLRSAFIDKRRTHYHEQVRRVLIMMGGTDTRNLTPILLNELCRVNPDIVFDLVTSNLQVEHMPHTDILKNVNYYSNLNDKEMSQIMIDSDFAISAAGQTVYELIATRTPFIAIQVADNQKNNIKSIVKYISPRIALDYDDSGFFQNLRSKFYEMKDLKLRTDLAEQMESIIDGLGRKRIVNALFGNPESSEVILLRDATLEDIRDVFVLSNSDHVRKFSINQDKILWVDHVKWFNDAVCDKNLVFHVASDKFSSLVGQVRYKLENEQATVSISLSSQYQGKGYSKWILKQSILKLFEEKSSINEIVAYVFERNIASMKLFERLNFRRVKSPESMVKLVLRRNNCLYD